MGPEQRERAQERFSGMSSGTDDTAYKRALAARLYAVDKKKGIGHEDLDDLLELMKLSETIAKLDLNKAAEERLSRMSEKNRVVHDLVSQSKDIDRRLKDLKQPKRRKKMHWKTRQKKAREYNKTVRTPRVRERKARVLAEKGWYPILLEQWKRVGLDVQLTEQEWNEHIAESLGEGTPNIRRYDVGGPVSLGNIWVAVGRRVVFDGMEYTLRTAGYTV